VLTGRRWFREVAESLLAGFKPGADFGQNGVAVGDGGFEIHAEVGFGGLLDEEGGAVAEAELEIGGGGRGGVGQWLGSANQ
jgi:hypothetical protein